MLHLTTTSICIIIVALFAPVVHAMFTCDEGMDNLARDHR